MLSHSTAADTMMTGRVSVSGTKVEARPCPICVPGGAAALENVSAWSHPALSCALFVADVVSLATARRAAAAAKGRGKGGRPDTSGASFVSEGGAGGGGGIGGGSVRRPNDSSSRWQPMHAPQHHPVANGLRPGPPGGGEPSSPRATGAGAPARWGASVAPLDQRPSSLDGLAGFVNPLDGSRNNLVPRLGPGAMEAAAAVGVRRYLSGSEAADATTPLPLAAAWPSGSGSMAASEPVLSPRLQLLDVEISVATPRPDADAPPSES